MLIAGNTTPVSSAASPPSMKTSATSSFTATATSVLTSGFDIGLSTDNGTVSAGSGVGIPADSDPDPVDSDAWGIFHGWYQIMLGVIGVVVLLVVGIFVGNRIRQHRTEDSSRMLPKNHIITSVN
ncbi:hypothetical protein V1264_008244 [Littorina saxatilis]|uniref:Uncharacterized protein n=1 Tax=Littorina saxatilis TaxID=31220 RepID=A0AAN9G235_9CAEN